MSSLRTRPFIRLMLASAALLLLAPGCQRGSDKGQAPSPPLPFQSPVTIEVEKTLARLLAEEDTDGDKKLTVHDHIELPDQTASQGVARRRGDGVFLLKDVNGKTYRLEGVYHLSVLLQELALAREQGKKRITISPELIYENPVDRVSRFIREVFWDNLTRAADEEHMPAILEDSKVKTIDGRNYLYVPHDDKIAFRYFRAVSARRPEWRLEVVRLPEKITWEFVKGLEGRHGLLCLKLEEKEGRRRGVPYVVPGGRFNEMYGWDSYFIALGLLSDGKVELAKAMVDNLVYEINHYGKILNANRSYYLTRSQPPFLTSMALAVYERLPPNNDSKKWLAEVARAAAKEYETVWTAPPRLAFQGLSRYYGEGRGPCPEVEPGHYDTVIRPYAERAGMTPAEYLSAYKQGRIKNQELDRFFIHDRAVRESGNDTTYRFDNRTADFIPVDLNSLLYKYETDLAFICRELLSSPQNLKKAEQWERRAEARKREMNRFLWDSARGMFCDYDFMRGKKSGYVSAAGLYPLWAGWATPEQASKVVENVLPLLEMAGGLAASAESSRGPVSEDRPQRQWDYPYGWAPHQMLAWAGLRRYGFSQEADRLTYKWLYMIVKNAADYNGTIPEKFDVVRRSHQVFAEYGNVGTKFSYITKEGFGWMNASFQVGLGTLPPSLRTELRKLTPPEKLFRK